MSRLNLTRLVVVFSDDEFKQIRKAALLGIDYEGLIDLSDDEKEDICEQFIHDFIVESLKK